MAAPRESPADCIRVLRPADGLGTTVFILRGRLERPQLLRICETAGRELAASPGSRVVCDVSAVVEPDAVVLDALARLVLTAKRQGHRIEVRDASQRLHALIELAGLTGIVPIAAD